MSHEVSETVQDPKTKKWINIYGRDTERSGQRLPKDSSGVGHEDYDSEEEAAQAAAKRSKAYREESGRIRSRGIIYKGIMK